MNGIARYLAAATYEKPRLAIKKINRIAHYYCGSGLFVAGKDGAFCHIPNCVIKKDNEGNDWIVPRRKSFDIFVCY